jgi:Sigma-70, region 4/HB1, ASXL, restriction endonuclease HTH domain
LSIRNIGAKSLQNATAKLGDLASRSAAMQPAEGSGEQIVRAPNAGSENLGAISVSPKSLAEALKLLRLTPRHWYVLRLRFGPGQGHTLRELGPRFGRSGEGVRQIEASAVRLIYVHKSALTPAFNLLEPGQSLDVAPNVELLAGRIVDGFEAAGYSRPSRDDVERLMSVIRAAVSSRLPGWREYFHWHATAMAISLLPPPVRSHPLVSAHIRDVERASKEANRDREYTDLAQQVLQHSGRPLHWSDMASQAEALGLRQNFARKFFYNSLTRHQETFVRVSPGTYGLSEWGLKTVTTYPEVIARILKESGRPMNADDLRRRVDAVRPIKLSSFHLFLDRHPRFYRSDEGTYGLRAWLLAREQPGPGTPSAFVERAGSFKRVQRAWNHFNPDSLMALDPPLDDRQP